MQIEAGALEKRRSVAFSRKSVSSLEKSEKQKKWQKFITIFIKGEFRGWGPTRQSSRSGYATRLCKTAKLPYYSS